MSDKTDFVVNKIVGSAITHERSPKLNLKDHNLCFVLALINFMEILRLIFYRRLKIFCVVDSIDYCHFIFITKKPNRISKKFQEIVQNVHFANE